MSEIRTLDRKEVTYSGLFRVDEFSAILRKFLKARGYNTAEKKVQEDVFETGKQIVMEFEAFKEFSDYGKAKLDISILVRGLKDKEITLGGHKQKYQHGDVSVAVQPYLETDQKSKWESNGFAFLVRTLMDKFVRRDVTSNMIGMTQKDATDVIEELRSYLNITRFSIVQNGKKLEI